MHLFSKAGILFFSVSKKSPCFTSIKEDGGDKRLVELELACGADGVSCLVWPLLRLLRQF